MKTVKILLGILLVLFIPYFLYSKYIQHIRFNPPSSYDYPLNKEVDVHYHNPEIVQKYYTSAANVGNIARNFWYENQVDVKMMDGNNPKYAPFVANYQQAQATTQFLEQQLLLSTRLKKMGLSNEDIKEIEALGTDEASLPLSMGKQIAKKWAGNTLKSGDNNSDVFLMQRYLKDLGYELKIDGLFENITKDAVNQFQKDHEIFANGIINDLTAGMILFEKSKKQAKR